MYLISHVTRIRSHQHTQSRRTNERCEESRLPAKKLRHCALMSWMGNFVCSRMPSCASDDSIASRVWVAGETREKRTRMAEKKLFRHNKNIFKGEMPKNKKNFPRRTTKLTKSKLGERKRKATTKRENFRSCFPNFIPSRSLLFPGRDRRATYSSTCFSDGFINQTSSRRSRSMESVSVAVDSERGSSDVQ